MWCRYHHRPPDFFQTPEGFAAAGFEDAEDEPELEPPAPLLPPVAPPVDDPFPVPPEPDPAEEPPAPPEPDPADEPPVPEEPELPDPPSLGTVVPAPPLPEGISGLPPVSDGSTKLLSPTGESSVSTVAQKRLASRTVRPTAVAEVTTMPPRCSHCVRFDADAL